MTQRIKAKQRGPWCDFCPPKTNRAVWRSFGWAKCSCDEHKADLETIDRRDRESDRREQFDRY